MTKNVRIENADNNTEYGITIVRQYLDVTGEWVKSDEWHMDEPCSMVNMPIYSQSRLIITEHKR